MIKNILKKFYTNPSVLFKDKMSNSLNLLYFSNNQELNKNIKPLSYPINSFNKLEHKKLGVTKTYLPEGSEYKSVTYINVPESNPNDLEEQKDLLKEYTSKGFNFNDNKDRKLDIMFSKNIESKLRYNILNYLLLTQYKYKISTSKDSEKSKETKSNYVFNIIKDDNYHDNDIDILKKQHIMSLSTLESRELTNTRANTADPDYIQDYVERIVKDKNNLNNNKNIFNLKILDHKDLKNKGYNLIHNVGKASVSKPRIIAVEYLGNNKKTNNKENNIFDCAIVGKGLTFDTGGLNLKPGKSMDTMYSDKHGACSVISIISAFKSLKPKINCLFVLGLAENSIDSESYKPSDIIISKSGVSVEIGNTDAEGRLVLADCFTFVQENYKTNLIIDLATLTGACKIALGENTIGMFSNNDEIANLIIESSQ